MNILLTNDDGFAARGINALRKRLLLDRHRVYVMAPASNKSGSSHSINMGAGIKVEKITEIDGEAVEDFFSCTGSPVDCIITAVRAHLFRDVDIVISGINQGSNLGLDVVYSGTCGAARQAVFYGIPGIALSVMTRARLGSAEDTPESYEYGAMADFAAKNLETLSKMCVVAEGCSMPKEPCVFVNVNALSSERAYSEARVASLSFRDYASDSVELRETKRNSFDRIFSGGNVVTSSRSYSDWDAADAGIVAVSRVYAEPLCADWSGSADWRF